MARARNIKPSFFKNEDLADLEPFDRLLFIGLWCLADREGRLEDRPRRIKIELFPGDSYDVEIGLTNLQGKGFIERYQATGFSVISLPNFTRHQSPHSTEKDSELPDCNGYLTVNERARGKVVPGKQRLVHAETGACADANNSALTVKTPEQSQPEPVDASTHNALIPDSLNPDYLNPEEDQEQAPQQRRHSPEPGNDQSAEKPKRGSRLPEDWTLPVDWLTWALTERPEFGEAAMRRFGDSFGDHWRSVTGKNATKLDWFATWRNWVRNQRPPFGAQRAGPPPASPHLGLDQTNHEEGLELQADGTYRIARP
ncbi:TPA: hypothetical protein ACPWRH_004662 [Pseudomonas aeruginosa]